MKKSSVPSYKKRNQANKLFSTGPTGLIKPVSYLPKKDMYDSVCEMFHETWPRQLRAWREEMEKKSHEPELFLFIAMICGSHFRTVAPVVQLEDVLGYLHSWFTEEDDLHRMSPEVAELVVTALTPGISKEIEKRGHKRGVPHGDYSRKRGKIPEYRGAWVAALVIANHLTKAGMKSVRAKAQAVKLMTVLLGKKEQSAQREFNRYYAKAPEDVISTLTKKLVGEYNHWMKQDGVGEKDYKPPRRDVKRYAVWKEKHKALPYLFKQHGREDICSMVLSSINHDLWKPLWDMKAGQIDKKEGSE